ncbi:MAG TPA: GatB/YqeY domain-containing protein [Candidatus Paceibacterota bacterium]|nr:GatB/YqeY domain-containing protein [Candidatus Paceibacterota bacterium]
MLQEEIKNGVKEAMMARDTVRLSTLRMVSAALTNELVAKGKIPTESLDDAEVLAVITRLAKQRKDSIEQFKKGNRDDLVKEEEAQLVVLEKYLPKMMEKAEIEAIAKSKKAELGIDDASKKGILMQTLMKELKGKADGGAVKEVVDSLF